MCRDTLSQNTHACRAVALGMSRRGIVAPARSEAGWHSPVLPAGRQEHRRNQPEPGEPALPGRGGSESCAAAKRRGKHRRAGVGMTQASIRLSCSELSQNCPPVTAPCTRNPGPWAGRCCEPVPGGGGRVGAQSPLGRFRGALSLSVPCFPAVVVPWHRAAVWKGVPAALSLLPASPSEPFSSAAAPGLSHHRQDKVLHGQR